MGVIGAIEEHLIEDLAFIIWEINRFRRGQAEMLNVALFQAVRNLLKRAASRDDFKGSTALRAPNQRIRF